MTWQSGIKCDTCDKFSARDAEDDWPDGWIIVIQPSGGTWDVETETHFCTKECFSNFNRPLP